MTRHATIYQKDNNYNSNFYTSLFPLIISDYPGTCVDCNNESENVVIPARFEISYSGGFRNFLGLPNEEDANLPFAKILFIIPTFQLEKSSEIQNEMSNILPKLREELKEKWKDKRDLMGENTKFYYYYQMDEGFKKLENEEFMFSVFQKKLSLDVEFIDNKRLAVIINY